MDILVVDPYPLLRMGLKVCLHQIRTELEVDEASTLAEANAFLDKKHYDLIVLSLNLPDSTGIDTATAILTRPSPPNVALCTGQTDEYVQATVMDSPARAIIKKEWPLERLVDVLTFLLRGINAGELGKISQRTGDDRISAVVANLSPRRREVLELLCQGYRNKEIAKALHLEENTVKVHVRHVLRLLGATSRIQAALIGRPAFNRPPDASNAASSEEC